MAATDSKNVNTSPEKEVPDKRKIIFIVAVIIAAVVAVGIALFALANRQTEPAPEPFATQIEEIELRGFTNVRHEMTVEESGAERFYAHLGTCRVRVHYADGLYAAMVNDYRVVDPTERLMQEDPVFAKCLEAPPVDETPGGD